MLIYVLQITSETCDYIRLIFEQCAHDVISNKMVIEFMQC